MNYTPKVRQKKSNFWGVFIMKLSYDDKVQIYELRKQGYSLEKLSNKFGINNLSLLMMSKIWILGSLMSSNFVIKCNCSI
ncbi:degenerate transposase (orf1) [Streptococcus pneumoniae]|nr:degenerate transposase (orf1) [Streptococcus pneumoniae]